MYAHLVFLGRAAAAITTPALNSQSSLSSHIVTAGKQSHSIAEGEGYLCHTRGCLEGYYCIQKASEIKTIEMKGYQRYT